MLMLSAGPGKTPGLKTLVLIILLLVSISCEKQFNEDAEQPGTPFVPVGQIG